LSHPKLAALKKYLRKSLAQSLIWPSTSPDEPSYFLSKRRKGLSTWKRILDMPVKNEHLLSLPPETL